MIGADHGPRSHTLERLLDRATITHAVVHDGEQGSGHAVKVPFVLGTPVSLGSSATAARERPGEGLEGSLDHVMCVGAVGSTCRWTVSLRRVGERPEELLGEGVLEAAGLAGPAAPRERV